MKFGKLFKCYADTFNKDLNDFSANRCSELSYAELRTMAKTLKASYYIVGDYTHLAHKDLAARVYLGLKDLYND